MTRDNGGGIYFLTCTERIPLISSPPAYQNFNNSLIAINRVEIFYAHDLAWVWGKGMQKTKHKVYVPDDDVSFKCSTLFHWAEKKLFQGEC